MKKELAEAHGVKTARGRQILDSARERKAHLFDRAAEAKTGKEHSRLLKQAEREFAEELELAKSLNPPEKVKKKRKPKITKLRRSRRKTLRLFSNRQKKD
jgi:hypothetical protein